jgi:hypothetical protein
MPDLLPSTEPAISTTAAGNCRCQVKSSFGATPEGRLGYRAIRPRPLRHSPLLLFPAPATRPLHPRDHLDRVHRARHKLTPCTALPHDHPVRNKAANRRSLPPIPNLAISNALRLSLVGWSKSLAREVAKQGDEVQKRKRRLHSNGSIRLSGKNMRMSHVPCE